MIIDKGKKNSLFSKDKRLKNNYINYRLTITNIA